MNSWEEKKAVEEMTKGTLIDTTRNCEINYSHVDTQTLMPRYIDVVEVIYDGDNMKAMPAADVQEVNLGYWIRLNQKSYFTCDSFWQCSECRHENARRTDYCPHCGARMDIM